MRRIEEAIGGLATLFMGGVLMYQFLGVFKRNGAEEWRPRTDVVVPRVTPPDYPTYYKPSEVPAEMPVVRPGFVTREPALVKLPDVTIEQYVRPGEYGPKRLTGVTVVEEPGIPFVISPRVVEERVKLRETVERIEAAGYEPVIMVDQGVSVEEAALPVVRRTTKDYTKPPAIIKPAPKPVPRLPPEPVYATADIAAQVEEYRRVTGELVLGLEPVVVSRRVGGVELTEV